MKKRIIQVLGSGLLTALLLYAVFSEISVTEFFDTLRSTDQNLLIVYVALSLFGVLCRAERYRVVINDTLRGSLVLKRYPLLIITLIRNGLVDFLPARLGEASFLYVSNRYGVPVLSALSTFGVCLALDIVVLFGLLLCFFLFQFAFSLEASTFTVTPTATGILLALTIALGAVIYYLDVMARIATAILQRLCTLRLPAIVRRALGALVSWGTEVTKELAAIKKRGSYPQLVLLTVGLRAAKYLSLYVLLLAVSAQFGVTAGDISPLLSTTAFIGAEASASLPISGIMGFGAYEAAWSAIFSISSVEIPSVGVLIFAVHIITQVLGYSLAMLALLAFLFDEFRSGRGISASNTMRKSEQLAPASSATRSERRAAGA